MPRFIAAEHRAASWPPLSGRRNSPDGAVAAADTGAVSGRLFDPRPRVRRDPNAACVFVFGADKHITRDIVADIRGRAAAHGRDPRDILISSLPGTNGLVAANITSAA
jgi:hypothetical protein